MQHGPGVAAPAATPFLDDLDLRRIKIELPEGLALRGLLTDGGNPALEVVILDAHALPRPKLVQQLWKARQGGRAAPLLLVALQGDQALLCGPAGDAPRVFAMPAAQAERICRRALAEPDRNAALRYLLDALPASISDTELPGIRNQGLLTDHVLRQHAAAPEARARWAAALGSEDAALLRRLGFGVEQLGRLTTVLRADDQKRAVAVLLRPEEVKEATSERFQRASPIAWALERADRENLPWVVMVQRDRLRLYPREPGIGVGRRGRTDTWIEVRTDLLRPDQAALLWLVFSAEALRAGGSAERLLEESKRFAADLAKRLRERIYDDVVPALATGIARARGLETVTAEDLRLTYAMALTVLFRLLFLAYAEDRDLLPFAANDAYRARALKTKAKELYDNPGPPGPGTRLWHEVTALFGAVRDDDPALGVPPMAGGCSRPIPGSRPPAPSSRASRCRTRCSSRRCARCCWTATPTSAARAPARWTSAACACASSARSTRACWSRCCRWHRRT
jgi:hypothetical protein